MTIKIMARKCKSMVGFTYVELPFLIVAAACFCGKMMLLNRMHMYEIPKKSSSAVRVVYEAVPLGLGLPAI